MSASLRRDIAINLGLHNDPKDDAPKKRQSLIRTWRRLSSLQRSLIGICVVCCLVVVYYGLPFGLGPNTDEESEYMKFLHERRAIDGQNLDELSQKLEEMKQHARKKRIENEKLDPGHSELDKIMAEDGLKDKAQSNDLKAPKEREDAGKAHTKGYDFFNGQKRNEKQEQIVAAFRHGWKAYKQHAWGHDELHPISKTATEWFATGLTLTDSLDTMVIMGLKPEFDEAREWVARSLRLDQDRYVNLFEITIRVLGSMLSTYHLTGDEIFKEKAKELGDRLLPAFNRGSKVPYSDVNLKRGEAKAPSWGPDSSTSEVTTIQLEFRDLSYVTGDPKYKQAVEEVSVHVHQLPKTDGLVPIFINANSGNFRPSSTITVGARGDSYYEYLLKQWLQSGNKANIYKEDFVESIEGMKKHLMRRSEPSKLLFIGELLSGRTFSPKMDHLVCFMGGTLALATHNGLNKEYIELGKEITRTCWETYNRMPTKLSPEITYFNLAPGVNEDLIVKPLDAHNLLRPETLESIFVLYRLTGEQKYRDWGWTIFLAFEHYTKLPDGGYSSIHNVKDAGNPRFRDKMETFFLAETLKYLYLLFSDDPKLISLDEWVFNSEAHPLPVQRS